MSTAWGGLRAEPPPTPAGALLDARGLSVAYGNVVALDRVDLVVGRGEVVALAGENGAGKSTLVRCLAGDVAPDAGRITFAGQPLSADPRLATRLGVAVVWQDLSLCDNLDIAANLLLGREARRWMVSATRFHAQAARLLADLGIRLPPTSTLVSDLSGGQRQLVAVARAMRDRPQLLILDEPTASLGVTESARVEELTVSLPTQGTTVLIVSHDLDQMFRLASRIVVLRRGRVVAEVRPSESHPDEVAALLSGQALDDSARRQLTRLRSLAGQLAEAEPSTGLELIMSALGAATGVDQLCLHVRDGDWLRLTGSVGVPPILAGALSQVAVGEAGGQIGRAVESGRPVLTESVAADPAWQRWRGGLVAAGVAGSWSEPFTSTSGDAGVVTMLSRSPGPPSRDAMELAALYAGYVSSALERDRLLGEVTARNRVLEAIRDVLQVLAGPAPTESALASALQVLLAGLGATSVALLDDAGREPVVRSWSGNDPHRHPALAHVVTRPVADHPGGEWSTDGLGGQTVVISFPAPAGRSALLAHWSGGAGPDSSAEALIEDAANSLRLALEREASELAQREAIALRRAQEQQRQFLSWLSHELRTPLTAIRGYASSLMSTDVDWDDPSKQRFLQRIGEESARLGRLVDDLLDFSAIDSGILRLQPDWCDLCLVAEAARACLPETARQQIDIDCDPELSVIWADHDRLEQILVNLLDNAVRHNPAGTTVRLHASALPEGEVTVIVADDGVGLPEQWLHGGWPARRPDRRSRTGGAGLGLSIARGIVEAHGGRLILRSSAPGPGTECVIRLPVALGAPLEGGAERMTPL